MISENKILYPLKKNGIMGDFYFLFGVFHIKNLNTLNKANTLSSKSSESSEVIHTDRGNYNRMLCLWKHSGEGVRKGFLEEVTF